MSLSNSTTREQTIDVEIHEENTLHVNRLYWKITYQYGLFSYKQKITCQTAIWLFFSFCIAFDCVMLLQILTYMYIYNYIYLWNRIALLNGIVCLTNLLSIYIVKFKWLLYLNITSQKMYTVIVWKFLSLPFEDISCWNQLITTYIINCEASEQWFIFLQL